ncbi:MAG TPA: hypothetical protein VFU11_08600 [Solirubrobacterales bacterium]|nr:hypothetical protein [Solirubrobacterales bacterium]
MELVKGFNNELRPGPYVDCPEEDCVYVLKDGVLTRYYRGPNKAIGNEPVVVDHADVPAHKRPRLHRIARMLVESIATARLASPFLVFVPRKEAATTICDGAGIVGTHLPDDEHVRVYYEGAVHGQSEMTRLADRVFYAHGCLVDHYPTVAQMTVPVASLVEVGTFDPPSGTITPIDARSEAILATWLGSEALDPAQLRRSRSVP